MVSGAQIDYRSAVVENIMVLNKDPEREDRDQPEALDQAFELIASCAALIRKGVWAPTAETDCLSGQILRQAFCQIATNPKREGELWQRVDRIVSEGTATAESAAH